MNSNSIVRTGLILLALFFAFVWVSAILISPVQAQIPYGFPSFNKLLDEDANEVKLFSWISETLPNVEYATEYSQILDQNGYPHVAYISFDNVQESYAVYYIYWNGNAWVNQFVNSPGGELWGVSIALDSNTNPHISYSENEMQVRYAYWSGSNWDNQTDFTAYGSVNTEIKLNSLNQPLIAYKNQEFIYVTSWDGNQWNTGPAPETNGCYDISKFDMDLDGNDQPHLVYTLIDTCDSDSVWMKYATWNGSSWDSETIRQDSYVHDLEFVGGIPYFAFRDNGLLVGSKCAPYWCFYMIDDNVSSKYSSGSLAVPDEDQIFVSYEKNDSLMISYRNMNSLENQLIDAGPGVGAHSSLAIDDQGKAHVVYYRDGMRYAKGDPEPPIADFSGSPVEGLKPLAVDFCEQSQGIREDYTWDFGDGSPSNNSPCWVHDYSNPGSYTVSLTISGPGGEDSISKEGYINVYEGVSAIVTPEMGAQLVYTSTLNYSTTIDVPSNAVTETITLEYWSISEVSAPGNYSFAGVAFNLEAFIGNVHIPSLMFQNPISVTIHYTDGMVLGLDENALTLAYWDGSTWFDAACGPYERHPDENWLAVDVCHLSRFGLFEEKGGSIFLPLLSR
jgi:PKD repeat protein